MTAQIASGGAERLGAVIRTWEDCDCQPQKCGICKRRKASLYVPVFSVMTTRDRFQTGPRQPVRHEHWCAPCRDQVFAGDKETAWCSSSGEWFHGQIKQLPIVQRILREAALR